MDLPSHCIDNLERGSDYSCLKPVRISVSDSKSFKMSTRMMEIIETLLPTGFVVMAGGYVAYLEGLTKTHGDVDFFLVYQTGRLDKEEIESLCWKALEEYPFCKNKELAYVFTTRSYGYQCKYIYTEEGDEDDEALLFNVIFKEVEVHPQNWLRAAKFIINDFDMPVCCAALSPDKRHIFRPYQASLNDRFRLENRTPFSQARHDKRKKKYEERIVHFGSPSTLSSLCFNKLTEKV